MTPTAAAGSTAQKPTSSIGRFFSAQNRYLPPLLITTILLVGQLSFGLLESFSRTLLAIGTAVVFELVLARLMFGKFPHLASAYITGISVGILIRSPEYWPYASNQRDRHHLEVRAALAGPASLEPLEFRDLRDATAGAGVYRHPQYPMGQHHLAHADCLGAWQRDCLSRWAVFTSQPRT